MAPGTSLVSTMERDAGRAYSARFRRWGLGTSLACGSWLERRGGARPRLDGLGLLVRAAAAPGRGAAWAAAGLGAGPWVPGRIRYVPAVLWQTMTAASFSCRFITEELLS